MRVKVKNSMSFFEEFQRYSSFNYFYSIKLTIKMNEIKCWGLEPV